MDPDAQDYARIEQAIRFLHRRAREQPTLEALAAHVGLSPYHLQRLFRRWAGLSPKQFLQHLTAQHAKERLRASTPVIEAALSVGLSGPSRLHDLLVTLEGVTPGEFKRAAEGVEIRCGVHPTPYGEALFALTARGLCGLWFLDAGGREPAWNALRAAWPGARLREDPEACAAAAQRAFAASGGLGAEPLRLSVRGTNFQVQVWRALLRIPEGAVVSYGALARLLGRPASTRAVAGAVAHNPVAYVIPCHRVLRATGELGGYRWGTARKQALLLREEGAAG
ncbi:MAG: bifunctional helix-turn-helix domain-containing protein/methylated-DNA--[protein]-cysteine S-methyltransferase [Deferrisomatales bacterium]